MKKNIKRTLDKTPLITIAINSDRNIIYYNNFAKQKFLFLEEDYIRTVSSAGYSFGL